MDPDCHYWSYSFCISFALALFFGDKSQSKSKRTICQANSPDWNHINQCYVIVLLVHGDNYLVHESIAMVDDNADPAAHSAPAPKRHRPNKGHPLFQLPAWCIVVVTGGMVITIALWCLLHGGLSAAPMPLHGPRSLWSFLLVSEVTISALAVLWPFFIGFSWQVNRGNEYIRRLLIVEFVMVCVMYLLLWFIMIFIWATGRGCHGI